MILRDANWNILRDANWNGTPVHPFFPQYSRRSIAEIKRLDGRQDPFDIYCFAKKLPA